VTINLRYTTFLVGLISIVLGAFGFHQAFPENTVQTSIYQAAQLFTISSGAVQGSLPWTLELARWLAPLATLGAILVAAQAFFYAFQARLKAAFYRDHIIVCGAGERGVSIACRLGLQGQKVVMVDSDGLCNGLNKARALGIPTFVGNGLISDTMRMAGISKAKRLIATCGSDEINLQITGNWNDKTKAEIIAAVEQPRLRLLFRDQIGAGKDHRSIRLIGFQFRAAKRLFYELAASLCLRPVLATRGARVFLEIKNDLLEDFIRAAILTLQIFGGKKPSLTVYVKNESFKEQFLLRYPGTPLVADLYWVYSCPSKEISPERFSAFDASIFCSSEDMSTLERAELFHSLALTPSESIYACLQNPINNSFINSTNFVRKKVFQVVDLVDFSLGGNDPLDDYLEEEAIRLHHDFVKNEKLKDPSWDRLPVDWSFLDESYRESNRLQAAGLEINRLLWKSCPDDHKEKLLEQLAKAEHMRWMADKVMHGWRWSGSIEPSTRDDRKRIHHLLVPFESLSNEEKMKDLSPLKKALG